MRAAPLRRSVAAITSTAPVVALGTFDGVHEGHRALIARAVAVATATGRPWLPVAFFPPPKTLFGGHPFLSSESEKHVLLVEAGLASGAAPSEVVIVPFDADFASTPAAAFVDALAARAPTALVVGEDFRFGRGRAGGVHDLEAAGRLDVLPLVAIGDEVVKSSAIRDALDAGDVERAGELLGAPYRVSGTVVAGDRRGRTIGVPTANLAVDPRKALPVGVFAVQVDLPDGSRRGGMANLGPRPSFAGPAASLEAHVFDWDGDLYGADITVHVVARLRGQVRFADLPALRAQLAADAVAARARLALAPA